MKWISFVVVFLLFSFAGFGQVNLTKIPLPSSYSAEVRGVTGSTSEGETVSGAYNTTDKLFHFNIDLTGRYKLYFSPTGGTPTTLDVLWSGTYGRFLLGANDIELSIKLGRNSAAGQILTAGIATGAVTSSKILDSTITGSDIAAGEIEGLHLAPYTITEDKIAAATVVRSLNGLRDAVRIVAGENIEVATAGDSIEISAGAASGDITAVNAGAGLSGGGVSGDVTLSVATAGITNSMLGGDIVTTDNIVDGEVYGNDIADDVITSLHIIDGEVKNADLATGAVTSSKILDSTITGSDIAAGEIEGLHLAPYTITEDKIAAATVVRSLNGLRDAVRIVAGENIEVATAGDSIEISASAAASGDITAVNAGAGLSGGGVSGDVTLSVATAGITNSMLGGDIVTTDNIVDGEVYGNDIADGVISSSHIINGTIATEDLGNAIISSVKLQSGAVATINILDATIQDDDIAPLQVVKSLNTLKDDVRIVAGENVTVTTAGDSIEISASGGGGGGDITAVNAGTGLSGGGTTGDVTLNVVTGGITNSLLAANSVDSTKISTGAVKTSELADASVTTEKIADEAVTGDQLAADAVTSGNIVNGTISNADLALLSVATANLQLGAVTSNKLASNSIATINIIDQQVKEADIDSNAVTTVKIDTFAVTSDKIAPNAITGDKIATGTIDETDIGTRVIDNSNIALGQVVFAVNGLKDSLRIVAGNNVSIATAGDSIKISASGSGGGGVAYDTLAINLNWYYIGNASTTLYGSAGRNSLTNANHAFRYWNYDGSLVEGAAFVMSTEKRTPTGKAWIDLYWEGSSTSGNVYWLALIKDITDGVSTSTAFVDSAIAIVAVPGTANTVKKTTLSFTSPTTAFQSAFAPVHISIVRRGNKATDTSTSSYNLINAIVRWEVEN